MVRLDRLVNVLPPQIALTASAPSRRRHDEDNPRVWPTPQAHHRLRNEFTALLAPARIRFDDEAGMVLTVRFDDTGETATFLHGARCGEQRAYRVPSGATMCVTTPSHRPL
ncbi:hypothetical protein [Lentzea sp. NPDC004782]|uniref:hypothetical protein n=1 Tax=Lentzea sp. NPDC004782 TaxID=3154458 RepID=UPI0033BCF2D7